MFAQHPKGRRRGNSRKQPSGLRQNTRREDMRQGPAHQRGAFAHALGDPKVAGVRTTTDKPAGELAAAKCPKPYRLSLAPHRRGLPAGSTTKTVAQLASRERRPRANMGRLAAEGMGYREPLTGHSERLRIDEEPLDHWICRKHCYY